MVSNVEIEILNTSNGELPTIERDLFKAICDAGMVSEDNKVNQSKVTISARWFIVRFLFIEHVEPIRMCMQQEMSLLLR